MSIVLVMPSSHLILCRPLLLLPSIFPSIRVFSNESVLCIRWPKDWSFSFRRISDRVFKVGGINYQWRCQVNRKHPATEQSLPPSCPSGVSLLHCWPQVAQAGSRYSSSSSAAPPSSLSLSPQFFLTPGVLVQLLERTDLAPLQPPLKIFLLILHIKGPFSFIRSPTTLGRPDKTALATSIFCL